MFKKNVEPQEELLKLKIPKYSKEQLVVKKALNILSQLGEPRFSVSDNCWKSNLKAKDDSRLWYARGLLESLLFDEKGEE